MTTSWIIDNIDVVQDDMLYNRLPSRVYRRQYYSALRLPLHWKSRASLQTSCMPSPRRKSAHVSADLFHCSQAWVNNTEDTTQKWNRGLLRPSCHQFWWLWSFVQKKTVTPKGWPITIGHRKLARVCHAPIVVIKDSFPSWVAHLTKMPFVAPLKISGNSIISIHYPES